MFCYCASSRRLARTLTARYDAAFAGLGMTASQFETLSLLSALGPNSGRVLAARLSVDKTTLSRNVKPLLEAGLIAAQPSETDGRTVIYTLSVAGRRKLAKAMPLWRTAHDATIELLGEQAVASERMLQLMVQALQ
jgi:DNA-binding MarR family transcriptional regulator